MTVGISGQDEQNIVKIILHYLIPAGHHHSVLLQIKCRKRAL